jgi:hypothetical protein
LFREQRTKRNAKRLHNCRKKAALKEEWIKNTPFAEDADEPFVPFIENAIINSFQAIRVFGKARLFFH